MRLIILCLCMFNLAHGKAVFWFTGLPCSGKTTIAETICKHHPEFVHLDGDVLRKTLSADLGFTLEDRKTNLERIAHFALSKLDSTATVLVTTISPLESHRECVRRIIEGAGASFYLVYVDTPLEVCVQRDVKGMYAKAFKGEIKEFTGITSPYEPPATYDLLFKTETEPLEGILKKFEETLLELSRSVMSRK